MKILKTIAAKDFIGRARETEMLLQHSKAENTKRGLLLLSAPSAGASELLKQVYDKMFFEQSETIPFYFSLKEVDLTAKDCAVRFLQTFLTQVVAFRRQDAQIISASPDVSELAEIAEPSDGYWIDRLVSVYETESDASDKRAFVRNCLSAPLRANAHGAKIFVMIDDLHEAEHFTDDGINFIEELKEIYARSSAPFVFAGRRRFLLNAARTGNAKLTGAEVFELKPFDFTVAGNLAENLANSANIKINEQTRDLITQQFDANPFFIRSLVEAASAKKTDLLSFQQVEKIYADELLGGRIGKFYDSIFEKIAPEVEMQKNVIGLLYDALAVETEKTPIEFWQHRIKTISRDFNRLMSLLNTHEIVRLSSNQVEAMTENEILSDYITARFRLETIGENRALLVAELLAQFLKRAPKTMAKFYRRNAAIGLRELLAVFDSQEIPASLLDYKIFKENYQGAETAEILQQVNSSDAEKTRLPQIVYTAHTVAFYPPIGNVTETERSAVALGFEKGTYTDEDQTVWIAAEIDSKLEAKRETAEFWCDRLEMVALTCNFTKYKLWLVAPEGFAPDAAEILKQRNAYGSSRKQIDLLIKHLGAEKSFEAKPEVKPNEYEIIVPMGEDTELIAAHTIEDIARRYSFEPKAINQIKTALVEACINATEHSLSPDRKIYQKFTVENDKIVITISNRGLRLADKNAQEITPDEGRRGWGLKLMKTLMDEVKFEQVDDGTRISMTKYLKK
jgi:serine/threonine-protein kinase RsbW